MGANAVLLPHTLAHYASLGFDSLIVNVHLTSYDDPLLPRVRAIAQEFGAEIGSIYIGKWLKSVNTFLYGQTLCERPNDWFVLADVDEFQIYPEDIRTFFSKMDEAKFDFVEGCVIDRIARDGSLPAVAADRAIWEQFPLAGMITFPILKANILKVVAAKGYVRLAWGQHSALSGRGCPREQQYIQVHHFKWWSGLTDRLEERVEFFKQHGVSIWDESQRFIDYCRQHDGKIDVSDPELFVAESGTEYTLWPNVKERVLEVAKAHGK